MLSTLIAAFVAVCMNFVFKVTVPLTGIENVAEDLTPPEMLSLQQPRNSIHGRRKDANCRCNTHTKNAGLCPAFFFF